MNGDVSPTPASIAELIQRMDTRLTEFAPTDARRFFHGIYCRTTKAFSHDISSGEFLDPEWVERWDLAFAQLYLDALDSWDRREPTPGPWVVAFETARDRSDLVPLRHILFGMNVHINYDLPQSLIAVIADEEFDDAGLMAKRERDHEHSDDVLLSRVAAEDKMIEGPRTFLDRILTPLNRRGTKRFVVEARRKVWRNARALSQARRQGQDALDARIQELDRRCAERVQDLVAPGQVILKLARKGFGVLLSGA